MQENKQTQSNNAVITVWDPFVRIFHWSLVALIAIAFLSGDDAKWPHVNAGYIILALVCLRVVWGFIGTKHARFVDFVKGPSEVLSYLKGLITGAPRRYVGHNPAGGAMIVALLVTVIFVCYSGIKAQEFYGETTAYGEISLASTAYADDDDDEDEEAEERHNGITADPAAHAAHEFWEETHEGAAWFLLLLIIVHITAAVFTSIVHNENLILSMITGRKTERKA